MPISDRRPQSGGYDDHHWWARPRWVWREGRAARQRGWSCAPSCRGREKSSSSVGGNETFGTKI